MPTYEYACKDCGEHLEVVQSFREDSLTECPNCEGRLRKVFSAAGIIFKGSGWHVKDYASSSSKPAGNGSSSDTTTSGDSGSSDSSGSGSEAPSSDKGTSSSGSDSGAGPSKSEASTASSGSSSSTTSGSSAKSA